MYACIYIYVCMQCMYAMYVCTHVMLCYVVLCMYVCNVVMYVWMYVMYACMHVRMHACMYACMHACICVCRYVYIYNWIVDCNSLVACSDMSLLGTSQQPKSFGTWCRVIGSDMLPFWCVLYPYGFRVDRPP